MRRYAILIAIIVMFTVFLPAATAQDDGQVVMTDIYSLKEGERVPSDLVVIARRATFENGSRVDGDLTVIAETVNLSGRIGGDVVILAGEFELGEDANIRGDLSYCASRVDLSDGAYVAGTRSSECGAPLPGIARLVTDNNLPIDLPDMFGPHMLRSSYEGRRIATHTIVVEYDPIRIIRGSFITATIVTLLGTLTLLLWPDRVELVGKAMESAPALSGGFGFLTLIVGLLAGTATLIICGLGLVVWAAMTVGLILGWSAWGLSIGRWAARKLEASISPLAAQAISLFGFTAMAGLLNLIPVLGTPVSILMLTVISSVALGAVVLTRLGKAPYYPGVPFRHPSGAKVKTAGELNVPHDAEDKS